MEGAVKEKNPGVGSHFWAHVFRRKFKVRPSTPSRSTMSTAEAMVLSVWMIFDICISHVSSFQFSDFSPRAMQQSFQGPSGDRSSQNTSFSLPPAAVSLGSPAPYLSGEVPRKLEIVWAEKGSWVATCCDWCVQNPIVALGHGAREVLQCASGHMEARLHAAVQPLPLLGQMSHLRRLGAREDRLSFYIFSNIFS